MNSFAQRLSAAGAFGLTLVVNGLAGSTTLIGGVNTAQISDSNPNLFAPAGFTFAIWGVIYALVTAYTVYSLVALRQKSSQNKLIAHITPLFLATSLINALWLVCWQFNILTATVPLMLGLLGLLIRIRFIIGSKLRGLKEHLLIGWPFSVYLGWISVATIANVTTWLVSLGVPGTGADASAWMVGILAVGTAIGLITTWWFKDAAYGLVFIWAFWGILAKHLTIWESSYAVVITTLYVGLAIMGLAVIQALWTRRAA